MTRAVLALGMTTLEPLASFASIGMASRLMRKHRNCISMAIKHGGTCAGFRWRYRSQPKHKVRPAKYKAVVHYGLDFKKTSYESIKAAIAATRWCRQSIPELAAGDEAGGRGKILVCGKDGSMTPTITPDRQYELDEIRLETDALEVGEFPQNEDMALVCKYMRHRQRLTAEAERIKEMSGKMLAAIDSRLSGLDYVYMGQVAAIVGKLIEGQKQKSIKTPWGVLGFRKQGKHLEILDETVLLAHCKQNSNPLMWDLVVTTESISKEKLKEYFERTGELPDGVEIVPETEKFYAR